MSKKTVRVHHRATIGSNSALVLRSGGTLTVGFTVNLCDGTHVFNHRHNPEQTKLNVAVSFLGELGQSCIPKSQEQLLPGAVFEVRTPDHLPGRPRIGIEHGAQRTDDADRQLCDRGGAGGVSSNVGVSSMQRTPNSHS